MINTLVYIIYKKDYFSYQHDPNKISAIEKGNQQMNLKSIKLKIELFFQDFSKIHLKIAPPKKTQNLGQPMRKNTLSIKQGFNIQM